MGPCPLKFKPAHVSHAIARYPSIQPSTKMGVCTALNLVQMAMQPLKSAVTAANAAKNQMPKASDL